MNIERGDIAIRLVEERARTGFSQADFARKLDVTREGLRLYETGQRGLSAEFLARASMLGVDVQYVLTGVRSQNAAEVEKAVQPVVNVAEGGSANVLQFAQHGSTVNMISTPKHTTVTKAEVKPGEQHISQAQAAILKGLVEEIVRLEELVKRHPSTYPKVWGALNSHCGVTRYLLIESQIFERAEKYLRQWIGRLNSGASAPKKDNHAWRTRKYAYIKINTKNNVDWLTEYLMKNFQTNSIADLSDDDLDKTYRAVASRKRTAH